MRALTIRKKLILLGVVFASGFGAFAWLALRTELIQRDTRASVVAIEHVSEVIAKISEISDRIAERVGQQSHAPVDIMRNVAESARGSSDIARNIAGVASSAHKTRQAADQTQVAANELARMSGVLQLLVAQFRV